MKPKQLLIVEDDKALRDIYADILQDYTLITACDGYEGFEAYKVRSDSIDLVVTDNEMPRCDGTKLIQAIKLYERLFQKPEKPIILVSGDDRASRLGAEFTKFILKPFDVTHLRRTIEQVLEEHYATK